MRLNLLNISRRTATLGFIVLFPGFLLYHYSIAQGWIPAFLGGLFGAAAAALAVAAIALSPWLAGATANGAAMPAAMTCLTIGYVALWATANYMTGSDLYSRDAAVETFSALAGWIALLLSLIHI